MQEQRRSGRKEGEKFTASWCSARVLLLYALLVPLDLLCELCVMQRSLIALRQAIQRASIRLRLSLQRQDIPQRCFAAIYLRPKVMALTGPLRS